MIRTNRMLLLLVVACFAIANFLVIDSFPLWRDEAFSVTVASGGIIESTVRAAKDVHPPLHLYLLYGWMLIFGDSEAAVRSLSLLFGVLSVVIAQQIGVELYGKESKKSVLLAALVASSPFLLYQSVEARSYAMLFCAQLGVVWAWLRARKSPAYGSGDISFVLFALLGLYSHVVFIPALFAVGIWQLTLPMQKIGVQLQKMAISYGLIVLGFLPWAGVVLRQLLQVDSQGFWLQFHPVSDLLNSFEMLFTTPSIHPSLHILTPIVLFFISTFGFVFWFFGSFAVSEKNGKEHRIGLLTWLILAILFGASFAVPLYYTRYLSFVVPLILIVIFDFFVQLQKLYSVKLITLLYILFILGNIYLYFGNIQQNQNLKAAYPTTIEYIKQNAPEALILHPHGYTLHSFRYYAPKMGIESGFLHDPLRELPHFEGTAAFRPEHYYDADLNMSTDSLLITPFLWEDERFFTLVTDAGFVVANKQEFAGGLHVWIWQREN